MKPKLTKAQLAKAKQAVLADIEYISRAAFAGAHECAVWPSAPEYPEVERLLRVALKAVRGA